MPKVDISKAKVRTGSNYPPQFQNVVQGREKSVLGDLVGLTQFGVNLTRLKPGAASALRHWHENEDEFVYILEGELVLVEDEGETCCGPAMPQASKLAWPTAIISLTEHSETPSIWKSGPAPQQNARIIPTSISNSFATRIKSQVRHKSGEPYA